MKNVLAVFILSCVSFAHAGGVVEFNDVVTARIVKVSKRNPYIQKEEVKDQVIKICQDNQMTLNESLFECGLRTKSAVVYGFVCLGVCQ